MGRFPTAPTALPWRWRNLCRLGYKAQWHVVDSAHVAASSAYPTNCEEEINAAEWGCSNFPPLMIAGLLNVKDPDSNLGGRIPIIFLNATM